MGLLLLLSGPHFVHSRTTTTSGGPSPTMKSAVNEDGCPNGWESKPEFGKCYYYIDEPTSWSMAIERCAALDPDGMATLASIRSLEENNYFFSLIDDDGYYGWIWATDEAEEGVWRWVEDDSLVEEDGSFTNWAEGQPNPNFSGYDCMSMRSSDGKWGDSSCEYDIRRPLCSKPIATAAHNITRE